MRKSRASIWEESERVRNYHLRRGGGGGVKAHLDVAGEGGTEHERLALRDTGHVLALDDAADLRLESHVEHAVSLVEDEVADVGERDAAAFDEVDETSGSGREEVAALVHGAELGSDVGSSVNDGGANPGAVGELAGLLVDLRDELTGRGEDEGSRVGLAGATVAATVVLLDGSRAGSLLERRREDREEESSRLAGTSLGTGHQVTATGDDRDGVLLDGRGRLVVGELDVLKEVRVDGRRGELDDGLGDVGSCGLDGDVGVGIEVDAGLLLGRVADVSEELLLRAGVGRAGDVLAVLPRAVAIVAASAVSGSSSSTRAESTRGSSGGPSTSASARGKSCTGRGGGGGRSAPVASAAGRRGRDEGGGVGVSPRTSWPVQQRRETSVLSLSQMVAAWSSVPRRPPLPPRTPAHRDTPCNRRVQPLQRCCPVIRDLPLQHHAGTPQHRRKEKRRDRVRNFRDVRRASGGSAACGSSLPHVRRNICGALAGRGGRSEGEGS